MLRIENKITGEIIECKVKDWKKGLNCVKYLSKEAGFIVTTKSFNFIFNLIKGYEDKFIKAYLVNEVK